MTVTERSGDHVIEVAQYGPDAGQVDGVMARLASGPLGRHLRGVDHRWMSFKIDDELDGPLATLPEEPNRFRGTLYDYTNERTLHLDGVLDDLDSTDVEFSAAQPLPTRAEWLAAVAHLRGDPLYGPALRSGALVPYRPMPPFVEVPMEGGGNRRAIAVGLFQPSASASGADPGPLPGGGGAEDFTHRVVAMTMATGEVWGDYLGRYPENTNCGGPPESDGCPETGFGGQAVIVVRDTAGNEVWRMLAVRPAASSGYQGSGIELRHVSHRGRLVLRRAHVPLVNVLYLFASGCGPSYRDWVNEETCFKADGTDVGAGFRAAKTRPKTILERGNDDGNFRGVAVHLEDGELRLVSEVAAGWYRYPLIWRLSDNGRISPRFGFDAVTNPCTCQSHVHHAYFRFDFGTSDAGDRVQEYNDPPLDDQRGKLHVLEYEAARLRDASRKRHWRVSDLKSGWGYRLVPGKNDAESDLYGAGDAWFLRHHADEIDDGQGFTQDPVLSRARLDLWADGEPIDGEHVVAWYGGHFVHDPGAPGRYVGPDLVPMRTRKRGAAAPASGASAANATDDVLERLKRQVPEGA